MHARASPSRRPFLSLSSFLLFSAVCPFSPFHLSSLSPFVLPLSAADFLVLHSAASLIVHVRLDARNGVACSAINGTLRFSRSGISPRTSLFVREPAQSRRTGRSDSPRLVCTHDICICVHARRERERDLDAIAMEIFAGPRASYRSTQSVSG